MRVLVAVAAIAIGIADAGAADLGAGHTSTYVVPAQRSEQIVVYDFQEGVIVREYWRAPWAHRHYFPVTGHKPKSGRLENLAARGHYQPAQRFYRSWSTAWLSPPEPGAHYLPPPPLRGK